MQDDIFVIDRVAHAFDMSKDNFADVRFAKPVNDFLCNLRAEAPAGSAIDPASSGG